jgi:predicted MPP superfamily phosphohydrolase
MNYSIYQNLPENTPIFTFSDIHSDIHLLILLLKNLAQVIEIKDNPKTSELDELEENLLLDLNNPKQAIKYKIDLNYKWIKENNSYIVIIGDIIDGYRQNITPETEKQFEQIKLYINQYPQIEYKILLFINEMNKQAMNNSGRIFKLLGNHEIMNMLLFSRFIFPNEPINYLKNINNFNELKIEENETFMYVTRRNFFARNTIGLKTLLEDGVFCILILGTYVFVHGDISEISDKINYNEINNYINSQTETEYEKSIVILSKTGETPSILWKRTYSYDLSNERLMNNQSTETFCSEIKEKLAKLINEKDSDKLKLFVGHSPQYHSSFKKEENRTYTKIIDKQLKYIDYGNEPKTYSIKDLNISSHNLEEIPPIFGITTECFNSNSNDDIIHKVDTGSSRAFDAIKKLIENINSEDSTEQLYYKISSRLPSLIMITCDKKIIIRKYNLKEYFKDMPLIGYDKIIQKLTDDKYLSDLTSFSEYKYLKYKNKYLKYKNKIDNLLY